MVEYFYERINLTNLQPSVSEVTLFKFNLTYFSLNQVKSPKQSKMLSILATDTSIALTFMATRRKLGLLYKQK